MLLKVNIYLYYIFDKSFLIKRTIYIYHIYGSFNIFNLNLNFYFLANSELIISSVPPLSNNTSTVTLSYVSILFRPIFTITSLSMFLLSRLQQDIFSITLENIASLLLLQKPNQGLLSSPLYLSLIYYYYCSHI